MNKLISFPTKTVRDKNSFDKTIRAYLAQSDLDPDAIEPLIKRLHALFDRYQHKFEFSFTLPSSLSKADAAQVRASFFRSYEVFVSELHGFNSSLLLERINVEIMLCRMETGS